MACLVNGLFQLMQRVVVDTASLVLITQKYDVVLTLEFHMGSRQVAYGCKPWVKHLGRSKSTFHYFLSVSPGASHVCHMFRNRYTTA